MFPNKPQSAASGRLSIFESQCYVESMTQGKTDSPEDWNYFRIQEIIKCKWMLIILDRLSKGVSRPGELLKSIDGLSKKMLYERLTKLENFSMLDKTMIREMPPIVHYHLTEEGKEFETILAQIRALGQTTTTEHNIPSPGKV